MTHRDRELSFRWLARDENRGKADYVNVVNCLNCFRYANSSYKHLPRIDPNDEQRRRFELLPDEILAGAHCITSDVAANIETIIRQPHVNAPTDSPSPYKPQTSETGQSKETFSSTMPNVSSGDTQPPSMPFIDPTPPATQNLSTSTDGNVYFAPISFHYLQPHDEVQEGVRSHDEVLSAALKDLVNIHSASETETPPVPSQGQATGTSFIPQDPILSTDSDAILDQPRPPPPTSASNADNRARSEGPVKITHKPDLVNEFTEFKQIMSGAFPHIFILGYWNDKIMNDREVSDLFLQADNRVSDDMTFVCYLFNLRMRLSSIRGVKALWDRSPHTIAKLQTLLEDPVFMEQVRSAKDNPNTPVARHVHSIIAPMLLSAGRSVPFASAGSQNVAYNQIVSNARAFSPSGYFLTLNPALHEHLLPLRLAAPVASNAVSDEVLRGVDFDPPSGNDERRRLLDDHPGASAFGYHLFRSAFWKNFLGFDLPPIGSRTHSTPLLPPLKRIAAADLFPSQKAAPPAQKSREISERGYRPRSVLGDVLGINVALENSQAGNSHEHCIVFSALSWSYMRRFASNDSFNKKIGKFFDSVVWNSIQYPSPGWEDFHQGRYLDLPALKPGGSPTPVSDPTSFAERVVHMALFKQNHYYHSFTCWKNVAKKANPDLCTCRLHRPKPSWDQETALAQLELIQGLRKVGGTGPNDPERTVKVYDVKVFKKIQSRVSSKTSFLIDSDPRILLPIFSTPSSDKVHIRTLNELRTIIDDNEYLDPDIDPPGWNQWFVETNKAMAAATAAQSNLQVITDDGKGSFFYIAEYQTKGDGGRLNTTVSLFYEATERAKEFPSQAPDAEENPVRPAIRVLSSLVNNSFKYMEFSMKLMGHHCLHASDFYSTSKHSYCFVPSALRSVIRRLRKLNIEIPSTIEDETMDVEGQSQKNTTDLDDLQLNIESSHPAGELARNADGTVSVVPKDEDYAWRNPAMKRYNYYEFSGIVNKEKKKETEDGATGNPEHLVGVENQEPQASSGRVAKFELRDIHSQWQTHILSLSAIIRIVILAGGPVPPHPGPRREGEETWQIRADRYGAYYVVLVCPWNDDGVPDYPLSWDGLLSFVNDLDLNDPVDRSRYDFLNNCAKLDLEDQTAKKAQNIYRNYSATKYSEYNREVRNSRKYQANFGREDPMSANQRSDDLVEAQRIVDLMRFQYEESSQSSSSRAKDIQQIERDDRLVSSLFEILDKAAVATVNSSGSHDSSPVSNRIPLAPHLINAATTITAEPTGVQEHYESICSNRPGNDNENSDEEADDHVPHGGIREEPPPILSGPPAQTSTIEFAGAQLRLIELVTQDSNGIPKKILLLGQPGTGKTAAAREATSRLPPESILSAATTGKAATLIVNCETIHSALGISEPESNSYDISLNRYPELTPLSQSRAKDLRERLKNVTWVIIDEVSMLTAAMLYLASERLKQFGDPSKEFGGFNVLLIGDFEQLAPVGGKALYKCALDGSISADLIRRFKLVQLTEQQRSVDPFHTSLMKMLSDPSNRPKPFTRDILQTDCSLCRDPDTGLRRASPTSHSSGDANCPEKCPHRCRHLKVLTVEDVISDNSWLGALLAAAGNSTIRRWCLKSLIVHAKRTGQIILKWRLSLTNSALNNILESKHIENVDEMWAYFCVGAPILMTFNMNTLGGLANGRPGVLVRALHRPRKTNELSIEEEIRAAGLNAGDILTLKEAPIAVEVQMNHLTDAQISILRLRPVNTEYGNGPIIPILCNSATKKGRYNEVRIGKDSNGKGLMVNVITPGYKLNFGTTIHSVQGETLPKLIVDVNYSPLHASIASIMLYYVAFTRVRTASDLRIAPVDKKYGLYHLLELEHDLDKYTFFSCYDDSGVFHADRIPPTYASDGPSTKTSAKRKSSGKAHNLSPRKKSNGKNPGNIPPSTTPPMTNAPIQAPTQHSSSVSSQKPLISSNSSPKKTTGHRNQRPTYSNYFRAFLAEIFNKPCPDLRGVLKNIEDWWPQQGRSFRETISLLRNILSMINEDPNIKESPEEKERSLFDLIYENVDFETYITAAEQEVLLGRSWPGIKQYHKDYQPKSWFLQAAECFNANEATRLLYMNSALILEDAITECEKRSL